MNPLPDQNDESPIREQCYKCFKPTKYCICSRIEKVNNRTFVHILQHHNERHHPIGTARFATLGLENSTLTVVRRNAEGKLLATIPNRERTGLLYPSPRARDLSTLPPSEYPDRIIVLDGTWQKAKKLYQDNTWLHDLPHYCLTPTRPSNYRIRREPNQIAISTIEAIAQTLTQLEPETDFAPLLRAFNAMIDDQVGFFNDRSSPRRKRKPRTRELRTVPPALIREPENIVVGYGENLKPEGESRTLVSWCALRLEDGALFEEFILPAKQPLDLSPLTHSGINEIYPQRAITRDQFAKKWDRFCRPNDLLCAWNRGTLEMLFRCTGKRPPRQIILKTIYGNTATAKFGKLDQVIRDNQLPLERAPFTGRAAERVANAIAITKHLRGMARPGED